MILTSAQKIELALANRELSQQQSQLRLQYVADLDKAQKAYWLRLSTVGLDLVDVAEVHKNANPAL